MTHSVKWLMVLGVSASIGGTMLYAQNDLEALLQDLGGDTKKPAAEAAKPAEKPAAAKEAAKPAAPAPVKEEAVAEKPAAAPAPVAEKPAAPAPVKEEAVAKKPAAAPAPVAEKPAAPAPVKEEAVAKKPAAAPAPVAEKAAAPAPVKEEAVAEKPAAAPAPVAEKAAAPAPVKEEAVAEKPAAAPAPVAEKAAVPAPVKEEAVAEKPAAKKPVDDNAALVSELEALETIRRKSLDDHGMASLKSARKLMTDGEYAAAATQFGQALEFIGNRPANQAYLDEARTGLAEAYYRNAKLSMKNGDREGAQALAVQAKDAGHPQADRLLEVLRKEPIKTVLDTSKISHRVNEEEHKAQRTEIRRRLRRSRQFFATGELTKALEQCELVLRDYPDTREAMTLRDRIADRMKEQTDVEFEATRSMMIREVRDTWNTKRYAIDSADMPKGKMEMTTKRQAENISSGRTAEQVVQKKLEEIVIPEVSFRPPATIIDAVTFFNQAARDYDRPELPVEQRGVNLVLKLPTGAAPAAPAAAEGADAAADPFAAAASSGNSGGVPVIPALSARFITLKNALKLVCDVTGMKSLIRGNVVMIVPVNEPDTELITRSYNVLASLTDRISSAQSEMKDSKKGGDSTFMGQEDMSGKQDWKTFFGELGVQWPEGSSIAYISTIGKLRVKNTAENLAVFEQVLEDLNVTPRLIEIEARFVEVSQKDLNSLGFEWLLNSDFSFGVGGWLGKNLRKYTSSSTAQQVYDGAGNAIPGVTTRYTPYTGPGELTGEKIGTTQMYQLNNGQVISASDYGGAATALPLSGQIGNVYKYNHNASVTAVDGSTYSSGMRYLNTTGNPISGQGASQNDQFMKVNAFLGNADLSMILHMLSQRSDTDLLNAPRVVTKNGQEAVMKVVTEYIYPTEYDVEISQNGSSSGTSSGNSADPIATVEPQNFEMREVGTILQVVPEVSPEGQMINLMLSPQVVSEPTWKNYGTQLPKTVYRPATIAELVSNPTVTQIAETGYIELPMEQPFFSVRSVSTQLSVYNGATVVIGGLITESRKTMEDKIPFLGDIPYLGRLFRSRSEESDKRNLLIFITARLVDPAGKLIKQGDGESSLVTGAAPDAGTTSSAAPAAPAAAPAEKEEK